MKAITVRQPWAWAIFHGKDVENRSQLWKHRGLLLIHAGKGWSRTGQRSSLIRNAVDVHGPRDLTNLAQFWPTLTTGAIIGTADLMDVHRAAPDAVCCDSEWAEAHYRDSFTDEEIGSVVHLVLDDPRELDRPIPCKGSLGLWTPDGDVLLELEAHL